MAAGIYNLPPTGYILYIISFIPFIISYIPLYFILGAFLSIKDGIRIILFKPLPNFPFNFYLGYAPLLKLIGYRNYIYFLILLNYYRGQGGYLYKYPYLFKYFIAPPNLIPILNGGKEAPFKYKVSKIFNNFNPLKNFNNYRGKGGRSPPILFIPPYLNQGYIRPLRGPPNNIYTINNDQKAQEINIFQPDVFILFY